jgi:hypothetical protein
LEGEKKGAHKICMEKCKQKQREVDTPYKKLGNVVETQASHRNRNFYPSKGKIVFTSFVHKDNV